MPHGLMAGLAGPALAGSFGLAPGDTLLRCTDGPAEARTGPCPR